MCVCVSTSSPRMFNTTSHILLHTHTGNPRRPPFSFRKSITSDAASKSSYTSSKDGENRGQAMENVAVPGQNNISAAAPPPVITTPGGVLPPTAAITSPVSSERSEATGMLVRNFYTAATLLTHTHAHAHSYSEFIPLSLSPTSENIHAHHTHTHTGLQTQP